MEEGERSRVWVNRLRGVLKSLNSEVKRVTGKEPVEVIAMEEVGTKKIDYKRPVGHKEMRLPTGVQVRYIYARGEYEGGDKRRVTDPIWSIGVFDVERAVVTMDQPVLYYLDRCLGGPKRSFVREELQVVPEDMESPPDFVLQ